MKQVAKELIREWHTFRVSDRKMHTRPRREVFGEVTRQRIDLNEYHIRESLRRWMRRRLKRYGTPVTLHSSGLDIERSVRTRETLLTQWFEYEIRPKYVATGSFIPATNEVEIKAVWREGGEWKEQKLENPA